MKQDQTKLCHPQRWWQWQWLTRGDGDVVSLHRLAAIPEVPWGQRGPWESIAWCSCHGQRVRRWNTIVIVTTEGPEIHLEVVTIIKGINGTFPAFGCPLDWKEQEETQHAMLHSLSSWSSHPVIVTDWLNWCFQTHHHYQHCFQSCHGSMSAVCLAYLE